MSILDEALEANRNYAKNYNPSLEKPPAPFAAPAWRAQWVERMDA